MGDALTDVWFSLLGLSYSLAHTYKFLKKLFFHALWTLRQPHLFINSFTQDFLGILLHIFLPTAVLILPGSVKVVAISLSFQSSTLLFINLSNSLVIVLLLMIPLCGMLFQMTFVPLPPWPLSLNLLLHQSIPTLTWHSPWCLTSLMSLDTKILATAFWVLLHLRVLLYGRLSAKKSN